MLNSLNYITITLSRLGEKTFVAIATQTSVVAHNSCAHYTCSLTYQKFYRFTLRQDESLRRLCPCLFPHYLAPYHSTKKEHKQKSTLSKSQRGEC